MTMLDEYGFRGALELDVATPRYRENPPLVASMLVAARGSSDKNDPVEKFIRNQEVRKNAYDAICQGIRKRSADKARRFVAQYDRGMNRPRQKAHCCDHTVSFT